MTVFCGTGFDTHHDRHRARSSAWGAILVALVLSTSVVYGQQVQLPLWEPPDDAEAPLREEMKRPMDDVVSADIDGLIADLGSPSYERRQAARERLIEIGPAAFEKLKDEYHATDELEVRLSIEAIVREAYLHFLVYGRNAFLGISQHRIPVTHRDDQRIREGHVGIAVHEVIEGTAAEKAGLQKGDVIIELNGLPVEQQPGVQATVAFGESIRKFGPGMKVNLTLLRGHQTLEKTVILGSRPKRYYQRQGIVTQMLEYYRDQFRAFWTEHFEPDGDLPIDNPRADT